MPLYETLKKNFYAFTYVVLGMLLLSTTLGFFQKNSGIMLIAFTAIIYGLCTSTFFISPPPNAQKK